MRCGALRCGAEQAEGDAVQPSPARVQAESIQSSPVQCDAMQCDPTQSRAALVDDLDCGWTWRLAVYKLRGVNLEWNCEGESSERD